MKKLLLLTLVIITLTRMGYSQNPNYSENNKLEKDTILSYTTNTFFIGKLEISNHTFPSPISWSEANFILTALGNGWRLPKGTELDKMHRNREKIGGFKRGYYWYKWGKFRGKRAHRKIQLHLFFGLKNRSDLVYKDGLWNLRVVRSL